MEVSHELFRDDVLRLVGALSAPELRKLFESPADLATKQFAERMVGLNLQTDAQEFAEALRRMLSKPHT